MFYCKHHVFILIVYVDFPVVLVFSSGFIFLFFVLYFTDAFYPFFYHYSHLSFYWLFALNVFPVSYMSCPHLSNIHFEIFRPNWFKFCFNQACQMFIILQQVFHLNIPVEISSCWYFVIWWHIRTYFGVFYHNNNKLQFRYSDGVYDINLLNNSFDFYKTLKFYIHFISNFMLIYIIYINFYVFGIVKVLNSLDHMLHSYQVKNHKSFL